MTRFIDDTCSPAERAGVLTHLERCGSCRARADAEATARDVLQAHAAIARTLGVPPPWRPRVFRLGQPALPLRPFQVAAAAILVAGVIGWWLRPSPVMAVGLIGDSYCHQQHARFTDQFHVSDRECTLGCVARGAEFVLVTDAGVYRIRNQHWPELPAFANQRVKVQGTLADGAILVQRLTAEPR